LEKPYSLRRELILDLSLLSFCAAILCSGIFLVSLRIRLLPELSPYVKHSLLSLHENLSKSSEFEDLVNSAAFDRGISLAERFPEVLQQSGFESEDVELIVRQRSEGPATDRFESISRSYLFVFETVSGFRWQTDVAKQMTLEYVWFDQRIERLLSTSKYLVIIFAVFMSVISVLLGYRLLLRRHILIPIENLSRTAGSFLKEDWSARVTVQRRDELGEIGEALNEMARKIEEKEKKLVLTIQSLQRANDDLEVSKNEQLQIEKLASVGRLAAGVAHEVGNPLGAISGYVDILRRAVQNPQRITPEDIDLCDRIEAETNRISKIIRALLQQARPPQDRIRHTKLEPTLRRSVELAQIPDSIEVAFEIDDLNAEVLAEKDQLIQVCLNMLINAKHAIEAKGSQQQGKITIRVNMRRLASVESPLDEDSLLDHSTVRSLKPQAYWVVGFIDNGVGISDEDKGKLFEPFFTTKATGKGTGLGLYVAKSIIESFRGTIVVQSALGYGSSFSIFLPRDVG
jgi:signal transduction histidine kinase